MTQSSAFIFSLAIRGSPYAYNQLMERGTYWVTTERMKQHMSGLEFKFKKDDISGLQIADLIAYPITRHVLDPDAQNEKSCQEPDNSSD